MLVHGELTEKIIGAAYAVHIAAILRHGFTWRGVAATKEDRL